MYYFIVNETGGSGRARKCWRMVRDVLKENDIRYKAYITKYEHHGAFLAEKIARLKQDDIRIVAVGGDGTVNEVINGIMSAVLGENVLENIPGISKDSFPEDEIRRSLGNIKIGVIPTGSGNDFINGLGLKDDPEEAVKRIINPSDDIRIDIGRVVGDDLLPRYFGISSGIGLDAIVCKKADSAVIKKVLNRLGLGDLTYKLLTLITLFSMKYMKAEVSFDGRKETFDKMIFLAGMNVGREGGGVPMRPDARFDDGLISTCAADGISKLSALFMLPKLISGKHMDQKGFRFGEARLIEIRTSEKAVVHVDGEYYGDCRYLKMECMKNMLTVM